MLWLEWNLCSPFEQPLHIDRDFSSGNIYCPEKLALRLEVWS